MIRLAGRDILDAMVLLPLVLLATVHGHYLLVALGQRSGASTLWPVAACVHSMPLVAKSMRAAFAMMDRTLQGSARTDGALGLALFRHVHLPQVVPPLVAAGTIAFTRAVGDFGVTLMNAGNIPGRTHTASIAIYDLMAAGRDREALVLSIIVSVACVAVVWLSARAGRLYRE